MACGDCVCLLAPPNRVRLPRDYSSAQDNGSRHRGRMQSWSGTRQQGNTYTPLPTRASGVSSNVVPVSAEGVRDPCSTAGSRPRPTGQGLDDRPPGPREEEEEDESERPPSRLVRLPVRRPVRSPFSTPNTPPPRCTASLAHREYLHLYRHLPAITSEVESDRLGRSMQWLEEGCFYYRDLDSTTARSLLRKAPEGSFLVRDSSDSRFLLSITVKLAKGSTSARIRYDGGLFQIDCNDFMKQRLPRFETLLDLLDFHVAVARGQEGCRYRWLNSLCRADLVIRLTQPHRHSPPSLAHLSRLGINRSLQDLHLPPRSTDLLPLTDSLKQFLRGYPFKV
ncbi:hypothetical protein ACOMHN_047453 [Nucella lapillus]